MVQTRRRSGSNVHAWTFTDGLQTLQNLEVIFIVVRFRFFEFLFVGHVFLHVLEAVFLTDLVPRRGIVEFPFFVCHVSSS